MYLAETFQTLHGCSGRVSVHHCLHHAVAIVFNLKDKKIFIFLVLNDIYCSSQNGIVICSFQNHPQRYEKLDVHLDRIS